MKKRLLFVAAAAIPWLASAQSDIDGAWKTDPKTVTGASKPSRYIVDHNEYRCESCAPKIRVPTDGKTRPFKSAAGTLSMNGPDGSGYDALFDGTKSPVRNMPGTDLVSVSRKAANTWKEISYAAGKPTWVNTMAVSRDGATMKVTWEDKLRGTKGTFTRIRQ